jgi:hypothetical protein
LNKRDYVWVVIKALGIYLGYQAAVAIHSIILGLFYLSISPLFHSSEGLNSARELAGTRAESLLVSGGLYFVLYSLGAFAMLRYSNWVARVVCHDGPATQS